MSKVPISTDYTVVTSKNVHTIIRDRYFLIILILFIIIMATDFLLGSFYWWRKVTTDFIKERNASWKTISSPKEKVHRIIVQQNNSRPYPVNFTNSRAGPRERFTTVHYIRQTWHQLIFMFLGNSTITTCLKKVDLTKPWL